MNTQITAKNTIITPGITNRIIKKTSKMYRYLNPETEIRVHITKENNKNRKVEITVPIKGTFLRSEAYSDDNLFIAIDSALAKIERQIHKHKDKLGSKIKQESFVTDDFEFMDDIDLPDTKTVQKRKTYTLRPMSIEDAIMNMELLGHNFFVYFDIDSHEVHVLYQRKDGTLGLLEPEQ